MYSQHLLLKYWAIFVVLIFWDSFPIFAHASPQDQDPNHSAVSVKRSPVLKLRHDFGNQVTSISTEDSTSCSNCLDVTLNTTQREIKIECSAPFPIDLAFKGHKANRNIETVVRREGQNVTIKATTMAVEDATGNYSCFAVEDPMLISSIYVYVAPTVPAILLHRGQTLKVRPHFGDKQVLIPCSTSSPQANVINLYKQTDTGDQAWEKFPVLRYNPKTGFYININQIPGYPAAEVTFKCNSSYNEIDEVLAVVVPFKNYKVSPDQKIIYFKENETFQGECKSYEPVNVASSMEGTIGTRTTSSSTNPDVSVVQFSSVPLRESHRGDEITCSTADSRPLWVWNLVFVPRTNATTITSGAKRSPMMSACVRDSEGKMKEVECNSWVECQMRRCQRYDLECASDVHEIPDGLYECVSWEKEPLHLIFFQGLTSNSSITDWKSSPLNEILTLNVEAPSSKKNELKFICQGSKFVFAHNFIWKLTTMINGAKHTTQIEDHKVKHHFGARRSVIKSEVNIGIGNFSEVSCFAPIWNSTEFKHLTLTSAQVSSMMKLQKPFKSLTTRISPANGIISILIIFLISIKV